MNQFAIENKPYPIGSANDDTIGGILERGGVDIFMGHIRQRFESYEIGLRCKFLTIDEVRALEGLPIQNSKGF